jgi:hypothetical protein
MEMQVTLRATSLRTSNHSNHGVSAFKFAGAQAVQRSLREDRVEVAYVTGSFISGDTGCRAAQRSEVAGGRLPSTGDQRCSEHAHDLVESYATQGLASPRPRMGYDTEIAKPRG